MGRPSGALGDTERMMGAMSKAYDITTAARGEIRTGGAVVKYDLDAGRMPDGVNPLVLEHLIGNGIAVPVKKTTPKKGAQQ